ncbi:xanthine dehydrogenase/oxidase [Plakobranchus ocellatus]|uniref:Xanthine dehydrogenase/oxidase n=1 Tax=Plakobranchus ocellatus TaxID=259542 RepID=A0AAV4D4P1_9GAST|nr:xanthine dehydrogenase/oxidase [Plakobranchus ocellatus]
MQLRCCFFRRLRSRILASGEPAIGPATGVLLANKQALEAARKDLFGAKDFIPVDAPFTPEKAQQSVGLDESVLAL